MAFAPGTVVGPYEIISLLGAGGMGEVYRAHDPRLRRDVAIKVISRALASDAVTVDRFIREAISASALNHPNVVTIYETGETANGRYIAMELVQGVTLREVLRDGLDPEQARDIGRQVAEALAVAHGAQIVHRDVKPENVMVREDGYVKVLDFGLARVERVERDGVTVSFATGSGLVIGTIGYMSPEQAQGEPVTAASDVFSLGVVLYEALTGQHPFPASSALGVLHAILSDVPVAPSHLRDGMPGAYDQIVLECLQKDPRLRPTALDVANSLKHASSRAAVRAIPVPSREQSRAVVGRSAELAILDEAWAHAAAGHGGVVALAGEAGYGKTALVEAFLSWVSRKDDPVRIGRGRCSERLAGTDAYLPVLEALESLLRSESHGSLARVMKTVAPSWYTQLGSQPGRSSADVNDTGDADRSAQRLKREMTALIEEASRLVPIVLFFDDLHWADPATVDLLSYLSVRLPSSRVLVVTTHRPSVLALSKHPFLSLKLDLQARGVGREVALHTLAAEAVTAYIDGAFPGHTFPAAFAALIHHKTEGHPLFMVDLLRDLKQRGLLAERDGRWTLVEGLASLEREAPESVRSMIERKVAAISEEDRQLLAVAAVQGADFDSAVVAFALELDEADVEERLDRLEREHAFVRFIEEKTCPDRTVTLRFRFAHVLYQNALFASLRATRRATIAGTIAGLLVRRWGDRSVEIALELAVLFETARAPLAAARYFSLAAQAAARLFAYAEAEQLAARGLQLISALPEDASRRTLELELQMAYGLAVKTRAGYAVPEVGDAYRRARELCQQVEDPSQVIPVLMGLSAHYITSGEIRTCLDLAEQLHAITTRIGNPDLIMVSEWCLGAACHHVGELVTAHEHLLKALELHDPRVHGARAWEVGIEPGLFCNCEAARTTWLLGRPDEAVERLRHATDQARALGHPQTLAFTLLFTVLVLQMRGDATRAESVHRELVALCQQRGIAQERLWAQPVRGWITFALGERELGLNEIRDALARQSELRSFIIRPYYLQTYAECLLAANHIDAADEALREAEQVMITTDQRMYEPELYRLQGRVERARRPSDPHAGRDAFERSLSVARAQRAASLELRTAIDLAGLLRDAGDTSGAAGVLTAALDGIGPGDTLDSRTAHALLTACTA